MAELFIHFLNIGIAASWLVLAVVLLRFLFRKAPKWVSVLLWGIVAARLLIPGSIESLFSLIPSKETVSPQIMYDPQPTIHTGISVLNNAVNPIITNSFAPQPLASANPLQIWIPVIGNLWLLGVAVMLLYTVISYLRLRRKVRTAVRLEGNIYCSEAVQTPFVLGIFRPGIYLPFGLPDEKAAHVIAHERTHIRRRDHWWKPLGFLLLSIHWYNPVMWLAYILLCRDIELACDEKVISGMDVLERADYSDALIACAVKRRHIAACPLAFGEVGVKARVKSVLNYKKPAFWMIVGAVVVCVAVAVCFLTDPKTPKDDTPSVIPLEELPENYSLEQAKEDKCLVMEDSVVTSGKVEWLMFLDKTQKGEPARIRTVSYYRLKEPDRYDPEYYASIEDEFPKMFIHDLEYNGSTYTYTWFEDGKKIVKEFSYLLHFIEPPRTQWATYAYCERYVLTEDPNVTWDDIFEGLISSQYVAVIPHASVYVDFVQEVQEPTVPTTYSDSSFAEPTVFPERFTPVTVWFEDFPTSELQMIMPEDESISFLHKSDGVYVRKENETVRILEDVPLMRAYFADLTGDGFSELCMNAWFGSGIIDEYIVVYDAIKDQTYAMRDREASDYNLLLKEDQLYVEMKSHATGETVMTGQLVMISGLPNGKLALAIKSDAIHVSDTVEQTELLKAFEEEFGAHMQQDSGAMIWVHSTEVLSMQTPSVHTEKDMPSGTVYGVFCCEGYDVAEGKLTLKESLCVPVAVTFVKSSTGDLRRTELWMADEKDMQAQVREKFPEYLTEDEKLIPEAMERTRKYCLAQAQRKEAELYALEPADMPFTWRKLEYPQENAEFEFLWIKDPSKAPDSYAENYFAYCWDYENALELSAAEQEHLEISGIETDGEFSWRIYNEDGSIYFDLNSTRSASGILASTQMQPQIPVPKTRGTYFLELTVYWPQYGSNIRYGMKLIVK